MHIRLSSFLVFALFALLVGCSGNWATVSGTVTLDGKDLEKGNVTFHPVGDGPTAYGQVKDGSFTLSTGQKTGLPVGKYKVSISSMTVPKPGSSEKAKHLTPEKYSRPESSGLEADVTSGDNSLTFELKSSS